MVVLLEKMLKPLMKPLYNLPGVASLGAVMTFLSDNPAIITLSKDKTFSKYFKQYQIASLTNFGTSFGMGLVVVAFMTGRGYGTGALVGLAGAFIGSIVTTRMMQHLTLKAYPELDSPMPDSVVEEKPLDEVVKETDTNVKIEEEKKGPFLRTLNATASLPGRIGRLRDLASNMWWCWQPEGSGFRYICMTPSSRIRSSGGSRRL